MPKMYDETLTPLLERCSNEELSPLVDFLIAPRSSLLARHEDVERHYPDHARYIGAIVQEIRLFGGHTIKDRVFGSPGRAWRALVRDALLKMEVKSPPLKIEEMERAVVALALDTEFDTLEPGVQKDLLARFYDGEMFREGLMQRTVIDDFVSRAEGIVESPQLEPEKVKRVFKKKTFDFVKNQLKGKAISTGLKLVARSAAAPIGVGLAAWELLGPAYRITIPVICYISYLRARHP